jgi:hypothetical protein
MFMCFVAAYWAWVLHNLLIAILCACVVILMGFFAIVTLITIFMVRPLLLATEEGVEYRGFPYMFRRSARWRWADIASISLISLADGPYSGAIFGRYQLDIRAKQGPPRVCAWQWELPKSAPTTLRLISDRYRDQIQRHRVAIKGL